MRVVPDNAPQELVDNRISRKQKLRKHAQLCTILHIPRSALESAKHQYLIETKTDIAKAARKWVRFSAFARAPPDAQFRTIPHTAPTPDAPAPPSRNMHGSGAPPAPPRVPPPAMGAAPNPNSRASIPYSVTSGPAAAPVRALMPALRPVPPCDRNRPLCPRQRRRQGIPNRHRARTFAGNHGIRQNHFIGILPGFGAQLLKLPCHRQPGRVIAAVRIAETQNGYLHPNIR